MKVKRLLAAPILLLLAVAPACAQRDSGASGDPTVKPAGDPHGAIKSMSQASEPGTKLDHATTIVPNVVPSSGSTGSDDTAK